MTPLVKSKVKDFRNQLQARGKITIYYKFDNDIIEIFQVEKLKKVKKISQKYSLSWKLDSEKMKENKFANLHPGNTHYFLQNKDKLIIDELSEVMSYINFSKSFWLEQHMITTFPSIKEITKSDYSEKIPININTLPVENNTIVKVLDNINVPNSWLASELLPPIVRTLNLLGIKCIILDELRGELSWEYLGVKIYFYAKTPTWLGYGTIYFPSSSVSGPVNAKSRVLTKFKKGFINCENWIEDNIINWIKAINIFTKLHDERPIYKYSNLDGFIQFKYPGEEFRENDDVYLFIEFLQDTVCVIELLEQLRELNYSEVIIGYYNQEDLFMLNVETGIVSHSKYGSVNYKDFAHIKVHPDTKGVNCWFINEPMDNESIFCYQLNI